MDKRPYVGIEVIIFKKEQVLLGKRKKSHGKNSWCFPGGHLEFKEPWEECASREVMEETGIKIKNIRYFGITNDIFEKENKHYVTIFMSAEYDLGEVVLLEPEKFLSWGWFFWNQLPQPLFIPIQNLMKQKNIQSSDKLW